jgi:hypothetical protein
MFQYKEEPRKNGINNLNLERKKERKKERKIEKKERKGRNKRQILIHFKSNFGLQNLDNKEDLKFLSLLYWPFNNFLVCVLDYPCNQRDLNM